MSAPVPDRATTRPGSPGALFWLFAGLAGVLHLAVGWVYVASGLAAPVWAVVGLCAWWGVLTGAFVVLWRRRSWWVLGVPLLAIASWFGVLTAGEQLLGWTA